jgi:hypothetical protein
MIPPTIGPSANPMPLAAPNMPTAKPSRARGLASRMAASMTPELPSWSPTRSIAIANCHGSCARATPAKTPTSTTALRMITAFRLYLSAQTPQSGTSGRPRRKTLAPRRPTQRGISDSGRPSCWR